MGTDTEPPKEDHSSEEILWDFFRWKIETSESNDHKSYPPKYIRNRVISESYREEKEENIGDEKYTQSNNHI